MAGSLSTRGRVGVALVAALLVGAIVNLAISSTVVQRYLDREAGVGLSALAQAVATSATQVCKGKQRACFDLHAQAASTGDVRVATTEGIPEEAPGTAAALLPGVGFLTVTSTRLAANREAAVAVLAAYGALAALLSFLLGMLLLDRLLSRQVGQLAAAAERIGRLDLEGPVEGPLAGAFEQLASNLREERARAAAQIAELQRLNRQLADARDSLVRSEKLATVGRLAAGVAHEVGNPLGAILGYLELARSKAPPEAGEYLERIDREVARIDRTVRGLLDFSRPAQASLGVEDLRTAVDAAVRLASVQKRLKHVSFDVQVPAGLRALAEGHHLSQVLVNVLLNAGDAMGGAGSIIIRARRSEPAPARRASDVPAASRLELEIADTGPGIAAEDLARIFDPFFSTKDPGEGTGLGLAICHRIMESFGGEIRAANAAGGGAVFTLCFREAPPEVPT